MWTLNLPGNAVKLLQRYALHLCQPTFYPTANIREPCILYFTLTGQINLMHEVKHSTKYYSSIVPS